MATSVHEIVEISEKISSDIHKNVEEIKNNNVSPTLQTAQYHTSIKQKQFLLYFMIKHPKLLIFTHDDKNTKKQWIILVNKLNSFGESKSLAVWRYIWFDWLSIIMATERPPKSQKQLLKFLKKCLMQLKMYKEQRRFLYSLTKDNVNAKAEQLSMLMSRLFIQNDEFEALIRELMFFEQRESAAAASLANRKEAISRLSYIQETINNKIEINKKLLEHTQNNLELWSAEKNNVMTKLKNQIRTLEF